MINQNCETVFKIGGEGGSIAIYRIKAKSGYSFVSELNEADMTEESEGVRRVKIFSDFNDAFMQLDRRYPWHRLYLLNVHEDYRNLVAGRLIERLNVESLLPSHYSTGYEFEKILGIKLHYTNGKWSVLV